MLIYTVKRQIMFDIYFEMNQKIKWINGWIEEWMDRWMRGWKNGHITKPA